MRDLHVKTRLATTRSRSSNRVRKERKPVNWRPLISWGLRGTLAVLAVAVVVIAGYEGFRFVERVRIPVLRLETIEVSPLRRLNRDDILAEVAVRPGDAMLGLRLSRIGEQLGKNPWIESVRVRRYFPHTLAIEVVEREPVAVVNMGLLYYLDAKGEVFKPLASGDQLDYPAITGITEEDLARDPAGSKEMLKTAIALMELLKEETTFTLADVSEIHIDKGFGFTLFTAKGGVPVRLGTGEFTAKLARFGRIYRELQTEMAQVEYIDCDHHDKIIVKKG